MTFKEKVNALVEEALSERASVFLIDLTITEAFKVIVSLDGDNGVALQDCIDISRAIESNLDREEQDFSLEVASVGVGSPLKLIRQYEKIEAELVEANDVFIILSWKAREPKKVGKGKETVQKELQLPYADIKEAIVTVTF